MNTFNPKTFLVAVFFVLGSLFAGLPRLSLAADLTSYTEEWPPYNFSEKEQIKGIATDLLREACAEAKLSCDIQMVPWARAYAVVSETPNTLLYTTARKPERENEFLWVGPLFPRSTWVYGRADSTVNNFTQLTKQKIGIVRGEAAEQDLINQGTSKDLFVADSSNTAVLKQLLKGWVEAMVDTEIGMAWNLRSLNLPSAKVKRLMKLSDQGAYYFALNLNTSPETQHRLQHAVDKLRKSGRIKALITAYAPPKES